ncbi:UDP-N-acetylglucosamine 2-epimerase (non-hydrolyzing) [Thermosipho ferrireducens]|uniref:UDP-N-acetylglucosamine 2-epimerase (non-hydrolyzing) n=1 Tax=Thermosipho ferrireducens TaxID=2571116 RepID=A0ABX7S7K4_9BACT|nr:UDP-N-acetylglucosamine 2-epimerase (non-hydrolyzing) [Thermosipho ferrireducens]QTA37261.1 UDP-N-acetylglucosamine 2-epimerase (non-hydrolyzing) [Thermosipho ferrireducens]
MKIGIIFGTRPEVIKVAPVYMKALEMGLEVRAIATAQHRQMMDMMLKVFNITPDYDMNIMTQNQSLNTVAAKVITYLDEYITKEKFDWIFVQGDTTTAMASAIAAFHRGAKVGHIEAGLRSGDLYDPFPEEMNRQVIDRVAELMFAPTEISAYNLESEGFSKERIKITGNTVVDALNFISEKFDLDKAREKVIDVRDYVLVTLHRRENWGTKMAAILEGIKRFSLEYNIPIVFPVHLNPKVREVVNPILKEYKNAILLEPVDYITFLSLLKGAKIVASDSGGVQEEAPSFSKYVVVCRNTTERPELIQSGFGTLAGTTAESVYKALVNGVSVNLTNLKNPFGDGNAAGKILNAII